MTILALFILALLPSLFTTWRSTLIAAGVIYATLVVALFWMLRQVDAMTTGEGPAFFAVLFLYGAVTAALLGACLLKSILAFILSCLRPARALWLRRILIGGSLIIVVAGTYAAMELAVHRGFAVFVGTAFLWLSLVAWRMPGDLFKVEG